MRRSWNNVLFAQVGAEFVNQVSSTLDGQIDAAPEENTADSLFRRRFPYLRRDGPGSVGSGDLAEGDRLASAAAGNDDSRLYDVSESSKEVGAVADAKVAVVFMVESGKAQFNGVIEEILGVLRTQALGETAFGAMPFLRKIPRLFEARDQDVGENRGGADQRFKILLHALLTVKRGRLGRIYRGDGFDCGRQILRVHTNSSAEK